MNMKKNLLLLGVVLTLAVGVTACSGEKKTGQETTASAASTKADPSKTDAVDTQSESSEKFTEFKAKTVSGDELTNDVFKSSKLTVVNVWGSWCGPCVAEIPELQKFYESMKDQGVNVIGVAQDADTDLDAVKEVIEKNKVTYPNLIPEGKLKDFVMTLQAFPTTLLVDSEGNVVAKDLGGKDMAGFTKMVNDQLTKKLRP
jgi:thioredoxin family protein